MRPLYALPILALSWLISCQQPTGASQIENSVNLSSYPNQVGKYYAFVLTEKPDSVKSSYGVRAKVIHSNVYVRCVENNHFGGGSWVEIFSNGLSTGKLSFNQLANNHTHLVSESLDSLTIEPPIEIAFLGDEVKNKRARNDHWKEISVSEKEDTIKLSFNDTIKVASINQNQENLFSEDEMSIAYRTQIDPLARFGNDKKSLLIAKWTNEEVSDIFVQVSTMQDHYSIRVSRPSNKSQSIRLAIHNQ